MEYSVSFGSWLQRRRKSLDLTQQELAHRVGCSVDTIKKIETDMRRPSRQLAELLADQLELTAGERLAFVKAARSVLAAERLSAPRVLSAAPILAIPGTPEPPLNPYKGLRAFQESDAADYFGRAALVQRLCDRLAEPSPLARFLAIVGPSGSGKSSVVQAGLLPALRSGAVPGSDHWLYMEMFPGSHPIEDLEFGLQRVADQLRKGLTRGDLRNLLGDDERGLARAVKCVVPEGCELMLVLDQFEEVFTLVTEEAIRTQLLDSLHVALTDPHSRLRVVVTLRADFYDRPLQCQGFGELVSRRTEGVPPLTAGELHQAIASPAERVGIAVEPALITMLTREVEEQPGALPLLQYTLTELFDHRQDHSLSLRAYLAGGGVTRTLANRAEDLYAGLDTKAQSAARQIFLRMLTLGEGTEDTRRRVEIGELADAVNDEVSLDAVVDAYGNARLFTFDRDPVAHASTVELAHEALIHSWPRLRTWVEESRGDIRMQRVLSAAAADWRTNDCEPSYLLTGSRLDGFVGWAAQTGIPLSGDEQSFLAASVERRDEQNALEEVRRRRELDQALALAQEQQGRADEQSRAATQLRRRAYLLAGALVVALAVAAVAAYLARVDADLAARDAQSASAAQAASLLAQQNYATAESQRLAAESAGVLQRGESAELSTLLALRAIHTHYTPEADVALQRAARTYFGERLFAHTAGVDAVNFAPDGRTFASGTGDGIVHVWDVQTGKQLTQFAAGSEHFDDVVFSADGSRLLTHNQDGTLAIWDLQGHELHRFEQRGDVNFVAFAADRVGIWVGIQGAAQERKIDGGASMRQISTGPWLAFAISPDDSVLVLAKPDGQVQVMDTASNHVLYSMQGHTGPLVRARFAQGGRVFLTTSRDKTAILWERASGRKLASFVGHSGPVLDADLSADGRSVITAGMDATVGLWDAATGAHRFSLTDDTSAIQAITFAPQGGDFLTASQDGDVRLWESAKALEPDTFTGQSGQVFGLDFSADGSQLLTGSKDGTVILWDTASRRTLQTIRVSSGADTVKFTGDGAQALVAGAEGGAVQLFDLKSGTELMHLDVADKVRGVTFTRDGKYILAGTSDTVDIWDVHSGRRVRQISVPGGNLQVIALAPSGGELATGSGQVQGVHVRLWDLASGHELLELADPSPVNAVAFSPDGKLLITAGRDNEARLWDVKSGHLRDTFIGHTSWIWNAVFSPDGNYVLTASQDRTARLWNIATRRTLRVFPGHGEAAVANAIFAPDGRTIALSSFDGSTQRTPADLADMVHSVCRRMLRSITTEERLLYSIPLVDSFQMAFWGIGC